MSTSSRRRSLRNGVDPKLEAQARGDEYSALCRIPTEKGGRCINRDAEWRKDFFFLLFSLSSFLSLEIIKHVYWFILSFGSHWSALCHMAMLSFKGGWKSTGYVVEVIKRKRKWEQLVSFQNTRICSKYFFWRLFLPSFQDFECVPFLSAKIVKWMKWEQ